MAIDAATLLAKLEANAKRQKQVNDRAAELKATKGTVEPNIIPAAPITTDNRGLPVGNNQR